MHDTDMAGILYFARQFRFAHDALEDFFESEGLSFPQLFHSEDFVFVIVHVEGDYFQPLNIGDKLEIHFTVGHIGTLSFSTHYEIYKSPDLLVGSAKIVHVTLDNKTRKKIPIPEKLREILKKHLRPSS